MSDLSVLEKTTRTVDFRGQPLKVSALKIGQLPAFTRAIRPVFAVVAEFVTSIPLNVQPGGDGEPIAMPDIPLDGVMEIFSEHGEAMIKAVAIALRKDPVELADVEVADFILLARAVIEVNQDFFVLAMQAAMRQAVEKASAVLGTGQMPSST
jgi:hypothetical protein